MALKLRRGLNSQRLAITPEQGELLYVTDNQATGVSPLFVGDGSTAGGFPVSKVVSVNSLSGAVELTTDNITEDDTPTNWWFNKERAQDAAAALFLGATGADGNLTVGTDNSIHSNITFTYNDSTGRLAVSALIPTYVEAGSAASLAYYQTNGSTVRGSTDLSWNDSASLLTVTRGRVIVTAENSPSSLISMSSYYDGNQGNSLAFNRSRGSANIQTAVEVGDRLGDIDWIAFDGDAFGRASSIGTYVLKAVSPGIIPTGIGLYTTGADGVLKQNLRVLDTGRTIIGPGGASEPGTGQLLISSTSNPQSDFVNNSVFAITQYFDGTDCQNMSMLRSRGTWASPLAVQSGDELGELAFYARDTNSLVTSVLSAQITAVADGAVSTGVAPGALVFQIRNTASSQVQVMKISAPSTSATVGQVLVNGTIATASTPATFYNYDSSASTLTLTTGGTVNFANFSGSVLVNCHNSGTVTQYLCGGGGSGATEIGSSKVGLPTGTMADNSGINGYTFTATETGIHSFYVIRTRTVA
jgi:hypothetical protein